MLGLWIVSVAHADPPNRVVRLWDIGALGLQVERMAVSEDGDILVGRTRGDLTGWMLDIDGWNLQTFGPADGCDVTGVAPVPVEIDGVPRDEVWMSCGDGSIRGKSWDGIALTDVLDGDGAPLVFDAVDTTLSGIWYYPTSGLLYALYTPTEALPQILHVIDPFLGTVDTALTGFPKTLVYDGFNEAVVVNDRLVISHGGPDMTSVALGVAAPVPIIDVPSGAQACDDLAESPFDSVYCVASADIEGGLGTASEYNLVSNQFFPLSLGSLINPQAICANPEYLTDGWLAVTGDQVKVWVMTETGSIPVVEPPYFETDPDADNPIQDMVTDDGYLYGGGIAGNLHIVTARPWVDPETFVIDPAFASDGTTATATFQVNDDSDWVLYAGGDRFGLGGVLLASGSAIADTDVEVVIEVDDRFIEGDNHLYLIATNVDGLLGHGRVTLSVDNPPDPPFLNDANVQFADEALKLTFDGIPDADLDYYQIWVSATPFEAADWPLGGPEYDGNTELVTPIRVDAAPGARVTHTIAPLENNVTYYIGVHAIDSEGKEGLMSAVVKGTPLKTYTAAELAGDTGGSPCSTGPSGASWLGLLTVAALATGRRIRPTSVGRAVVGAAVAVGLGVSGTAQAQDEDPWWRQDTTKSRANFEMRYGVINLVDEDIQRVYSNSPANLLQMELGPQIFRVAEVDLSFGFLQELSYSIASDGQVSSERTMMTWWPLGIDVTGRAHILDEQPAVPFARYGWDYIIWSERSDDGFGGKDVVHGGKFGTHVGLGVDFLLDLVSPGRASLLEAQTGINDSWLSIEWRHQSVDGRVRPWSGPDTEDSLNFGGDAVLVGLKLDW